MKGYNVKSKLTSPLIFAFFFLIFTCPIFTVLSHSAEDIHESRLDMGLKNNEPYSYVLIKKANADPSKARSLLTEALRHSPNLPPAYFEMAKISFSPSAKGIFESLDYAVNESRDNKYAASVLKNKDDFISLFSYGLALKREGRYEPDKKRIPYPPFITPVIFLVSLFIAITSCPSQRSDHADRIKTSADIDNIRFIIEAYKYANNSYPQSIAQIIKTADSWGRQYIYKPAAGDFVLFSAGPDGKEGTEDDIY